VIVGSTGDNEKSCPSRTGFFQPANFEKLDDWTIKSSPKELKFWGDENDDFMNTSPKDFDESPHRLRGIERNRSKSVVFSRTQKLRFEGARESQGFSTRLEGLGTPQEVTKTTRNNSSPRAQESTTKIEIQPNKARNEKGLRRDQNPGGHKEDRASFPNQIHSKVSTIHP
jgi:hypothetical protein